MIKPTREIAAKILTLLDAGLTKGLGEPYPGKMCVEALVNFALGLPHNDQPPCVGDAVRRFKIRLNDSNWSSNQARAKGFRRLAIAQLGSNEIDQVQFVKKLALATIREIVPIGLRAAAKIEQNDKRHADLIKAASECEAALDLKAARRAAAAAAAYAAYAAAAAAYAAAADAAAYAAAAADAAAYAAAADAYAAAAADAAAAAYAAAYAARDEVLTASAEIGVRILVELKSPGCEWLDLP
jgi:hypothetical protein